VKLVFLGKLADIAGAERTLDGPDAKDWAALLATLEPEVAAALADSRVKVAVNGVVLADRAALVARPGDEIAFLPPVSGG
jgi:molybdopterin synthase sulfur carrier subunit